MFEQLIKSDRFNERTVYNMITFVHNILKLLQTGSHIIPLATCTPVHTAKTVRNINVDVCINEEICHLINSKIPKFEFDISIGKISIHTHVHTHIHTHTYTHTHTLIHTYTHTHTHTHLVNARRSDEENVLPTSWERTFSTFSPILVLSTVESNTKSVIKL